MEPTILRTGLALALTLATTGACSSERNAPGSARVEVRTAALAFADLGHTCFDLAVSNGTETVWSRGDPLRTRLGADQTADNGPDDDLDEDEADSATICSDDFGNGGGGAITYIGPCDATADSDGDVENGVQNLVTLWVDGLYDEDGEADIGQWRDPCPPGGCKLHVPCSENEDSLVELNLTIMRAANQGFFDVAVNFDDIFCSAKVDCVNDQGPALLLHHPQTGARAQTAVVALACTGGVTATPQSENDTVLLRDSLTITCGATETVLDPTLGPGYVYGAAHPDPEPDDAIWQYATYHGEEALDCLAGRSCNKRYWNVAIGFDPMAPGCTLTTVATAASADTIAAFSTPPASTYPLILVDVPLTGPQGGLVCSSHPLDGTPPGVSTDYTDVAAPATLCHRYDGSGMSSTCGDLDYTRDVSGLIYINANRLGCDPAPGESCNGWEGLSDAEFQALAESDDYTYAMVQVIAGSEELVDEPGCVSCAQWPLHKERIRQLAQHGKRVVLQIWYGPSGRYNWSYFGYPHLAMNPTVAAELFAEVDTLINAIGPEHIYGAHLLEEDYDAHGLDIDKPAVDASGRAIPTMDVVAAGDGGCAAAGVSLPCEDGFPNTNSGYLTARYSQSIALGGVGDYANTESSWSPYEPNIFFYNQQFIDETGLEGLGSNHDLSASAHAWGVQDRWMAERLWARAHIVFGEHLRATFPTIKFFAWGDMAYRWTGVSMAALAGHVDGVIVDPYHGAYANWHTLASMRALVPDAELLVLMRGLADRADRRLQATLAYLAGAHAIGFFEDADLAGRDGLMDWQKPSRWAESTAIWQGLRGLPRVNHLARKVLEVTGNTVNGSYASQPLLGFFDAPDMVHSREAGALTSLDAYELIIAAHTTSADQAQVMLDHSVSTLGLDDPLLRDWVQDGGVLVWLTPWTFPQTESFMVTEGLAWNGAVYETLCVDNVVKNIEVAPGITVQWDGSDGVCRPLELTTPVAAANKYGLDAQYTLLANVWEQVWADPDWEPLPLGGVLPYGQGAIVLLNGYALTDGRAAMRDYLADVIRGVADYYLGDGDGHAPHVGVAAEVDVARDSYHFLSADGRVRVDAMHQGDGQIHLDGVPVWPDGP